MVSSLRNFVSMFLRENQETKKIKSARPSYNENSKICWNCKYYCTFACLCHMDGVQKDYAETCNLFKKDE